MPYVAAYTPCTGHQVLRGLPEEAIADEKIKAITRRSGWARSIRNSPTYVDENFVTRTVHQRLATPRGAARMRCIR